MKRFHLILLILLISGTILHSQSTGLVENFNDNVLTGWDNPQTTGTFTLTEEDSVLRIDYNRTAQSWEWDNFNFTPAEVLDVTENPFISLRVKSNINTELTFKPVANSEEMDWKQIIISSDGKWHTINFNLTKRDLYTIERIYMYLDAGSTVQKSGTVWFDDMRIGDSVRTVDSLDLTEVECLIPNANKLHDNAVEGNNEGQFKPGSKAILKAIIQEAEVFLQSVGIDQSGVDSVVWKLADACVNLETSAHASSLEMVDSKATKETKYLYFNLNQLADDYLLFGMHDATGYGVGWSGDDDRSDVKTICGSYPAIYSEDFNDLVFRNNEVDRTEYRLTSAYNRGGIITMSWHQYDPLGRSFYSKDTNNDRVVESILPGGEYHDYYKGSLLKIARFLKTLRGAKGESIPVIFRPYHEHTGSWFWWGVGHCTTSEYNRVWRFTVEYLRDSLNVHNLVYALSPSLSHLDDENDYFNIYPGDDYVDIMGTDHYLGNPPDKNTYIKKLKYVISGSKKRNKVVALTEIGNENLEDRDFFTDVILNPILADTVLRRISYAAVWRNQDTGHHFAPYPGHPSVDDFLEFYNHPYTIFEESLPDMYTPTIVDSIAPVFTEYPEEYFLSFYTEVEVHLVTSERSFLRYGFDDLSYDDLPFVFEYGEGTWDHSTIINGEQGESHTLYIHARDFVGNKTAEPLAITIEIDTLQRPLSWYDRQYSDSDWEKAAAPFIFSGNSGQGSTINTVNTAYFRKPFYVEDPDSIFQFVIFPKYDNGVVVYLSGKEVKRINMPGGEISFESKALEETKPTVYFVIPKEDLAFLVKGENILGVEVHQSENEMDDFLFDLKMIDPSTVIDFGEEWHYSDAGSEPEMQTLGAVGVEEFFDLKPTSFELFQNFPNPFNPVTTIRYSVGKSVETRNITSQQVNLSIYNTLGQKITTLVSEQKPAGIYNVQWDASSFAAGSYLYKLSIGEQTQIRKMILLK